MAKAKVHAERCKSCGCCLGNCPAKALSVSECQNKQGFRVVQVDENKCIGCGACYVVCPDYVFEIF